MSNVPENLKTDWDHYCEHPVTDLKELVRRALDVYHLGQSSPISGCVDMGDHLVAFTHDKPLPRRIKITIEEMPFKKKDS